jgi:L-malate glycosyltransferase
MHLLPSMRIGGMENQATRIIETLVARGGFRVHAAGLGGAGPVLEALRGLGLEEVPLYPLTGMARVTTAAHIRSFSVLLRGLGVDVLHAHDFYTNTFGMAAGVLAGVPVRIASRRELDVFTPAQRAVERAACRFAHVVAANCEFLRARLEEEGIPSERTMVIPNAVALPRPELARDRGPARAALGLPAAARVVVMVANLHNVKKDPATAARAMDMVAAARDNVILVLVGAGTPPAEVEDAIARGRVLFAGAQQNVVPWLAAADICILSSRSEGLSNAVMEYMAAARPVVASDVGGMAELIRHGRTGLLVPPGDAAALAAAVDALLDDPVRAAGMGRLGRERILAHYTPARQGDSVEELYRRLLASSLSARS